MTTDILPMASVQARHDAAALLELLPLSTLDADGWPTAILEVRDTSGQTVRVVFDSVGEVFLPEMEDGLNLSFEALQEIAETAGKVVDIFDAWAETPTGLALVEEVIEL